MGLADTFGKEDRVTMTFSQFYNLVKEGTKSELMQNAINCNVPHVYMRETLTGKSEELETENIDTK